MKNENSDKNVTILDIQNKSKKEEWTIIGGQKKWIRNCPKCSKPIHYNTRYHKESADKKNTKCVSCCATKHTYPKKLIRYCPECNKILVYSEGHNWLRAVKENWMCMECAWTHKRKLKRIQPSDLKRNCPECKNELNYSDKGCRDRSEKDKALCKRCANLKRISKLKFNNLPVIPSFNPKACRFIEKYGKKCGYDFQHAMNGGEFSVLGYFVDGYDKEKNVVFEYDEPQHVWKQEKDLRRMNEIKQHLGCKFIRYNEKLNEVKEY